MIYYSTRHKQRFNRLGRKFDRAFGNGALMLAVFIILLSLAQN